MKGIDKVDVEHFFQLDDCCGYDLRGHSLKIKVKRSRLQLQQGFFSQRVVCAWNSLPSSVVEASTVSIFKKRLEDWSHVDFKASASRPLHLQVTSYNRSILF